LRKRIRSISVEITDSAPGNLIDSNCGPENLGRGLPLGIFKDATCKELERPLEPGQIIVIGTDGIWESRNEKGEIYGKEAFKDIIRSQAQQPAGEILRTTFDALEDFHSSGPQEDDVTLVIIKVEQQIHRLHQRERGTTVAMYRIFFYGS